IDFLTNNSDPRLSKIYAPATANGLFAGSVLGKLGGLPGNQLSRFGPGILKGAGGTIPVSTAGAASPSVMMLAAESYFLQAEAALRGWIPGNAQTLYESGVAASFSYLGATGAATYYGQSGNANTTWAATTGYDEQLSLIIRQKWVALNSINSFEAWNDRRRFDYEHPAGPLGDIPLSISPNIDVPKIPYRILYPTIELQTNKTNVLAQGTINHQASKIFWMR
ncbi:MAG TPA: SusD/RagB family nutrient-binding outer membrane lipoprotein, partial [Chitinophagaceae bacterium]|nr:SusD/RagB family nutrient-binding outer membrane lipoprotein [Chitinophagaceae bacterium]